MRWAAVALAGVLAWSTQAGAFAQATEGAMSDSEVESLRVAAPYPLERIAVFERMLNDREKTINTLVAKPHRPSFGSDMHDTIEEFGAIADELNDNLDDYNDKHHDVRKALPKLIATVERWMTSLRAAGDDDRYQVVRKIALDRLKDLHELAVQMSTTQDTYFKDHPEALKAEKARSAGDNPQ